MQSRKKVEIHGKIIHISKTQTFESGFQKREFVIMTDGEYPDEIPFELKKDNVSKIDKYKVGDIVTASGYIGGRGWQKDDQTPKRWFLSLNCVNIEGATTPQEVSQEDDFGQDPPF